MVFTIKGAVTTSELVRAVEMATQSFVDTSLRNSEAYSVITKLWTPSDFDSQRLLFTFPEDVETFTDIYHDINQLVPGLRESIQAASSDFGGYIYSTRDDDDINEPYDAEIWMCVMHKTLLDDIKSGIAMKPMTSEFVLHFPEDGRNQRRYQTFMEGRMQAIQQRFDGLMPGTQYMPRDLFR